MNTVKELGSPEAKELLEDWMAHRNESEGTQQRAKKLAAVLEVEKESVPAFAALIEEKELFVKTSQWMIGGDGWAYDIGYGGIDHVLASGADVNLLVLDNEVYSNTGGQVSKATPMAAIAKFAAGGKYMSKKDLGRMAMTYGNVYVAQISSGANAMQTIKAFEEAEKFPGPSLIIAYTPCITHGLAGGMRKSLQEAKDAVQSGYWSLYRYHPDNLEKGKAGLTLDYKKPDFSLMPAFLRSQVRFSSLEKQFPAVAEQLFAKTVTDAQTRFFAYADMSGQGEKIREKVLNQSQTQVTDDTSQRPVRERKERLVDSEAEARRLARRAERQAKRQETKKEKN